MTTANQAGADPWSPQPRANVDRLSLDQLRVLVVAAEEGSFSAAARRLDRVQSAVTYSIQQLEQQLGIEVFDRSGYRPRLNAAGESILEDARIILARVDALIAKCRSSPRPP